MQLEDDLRGRWFIFGARKGSQANGLWSCMGSWEGLIRGSKQMVPRKWSHSCRAVWEEGLIRGSKRSNSHLGSKQLAGSLWNADKKVDYGGAREGSSSHLRGICPTYTSVSSLEKLGNFLLAHSFYWS